MWPRLTETQIWCLPAGSVGRNNGICQHACLWESCPSSPHPDARQFNSSISLVPFELLPQHWSSEHMSLCKSVCGHFKRNTWDSSSTFPSPPTPPHTHLSHNLAGFYSYKSWGLFFWAVEPELGGLVWGWGHLISLFVQFPALLRVVCHGWERWGSLWWSTEDHHQHPISELCVWALMVWEVAMDVHGRKILPMWLRYLSLRSRVIHYPP